MGDWIGGSNGRTSSRDRAARFPDRRADMTPLGAWGKPYTPPTNLPFDKKVNTGTTPPNQVAAMDADTFFKRLASAMKDNPPYAGDGPALEKLKKLGIEPGRTSISARLIPVLRAVFDGRSRKRRSSWPMAPPR